EIQLQRELDDPWRNAGRRNDSERWIGVKAHHAFGSRQAIDSDQTNRAGVLKCRQGKGRRVKGVVELGPELQIPRFAVTEWNVLDDGNVELLLSRTGHVPDAAVAERGRHAIGSNYRRCREAGAIKVSVQAAAHRTMSYKLRRGAARNVGAVLVGCDDAECIHFIALQNREPLSALECCHTGDRPPR